jgi:hypothetical protein
MGSALFHEDGQKDRQTDMTKLVDSFRNFAKASKNVMFVLHVYEKLNHENFIDGFVQNNFN